MATLFDAYAIGSCNFNRTLTDIVPAMPHINVRQFLDTAAGTWKGATGGGTADDYAVFAAAIVEAAASNKVLLVPAGSYKIGTKLAISDIQVICSPHAQFIPGTLNMTMVEMQKNSFWQGGFFNASSLNFTGIMMLMDGSTNALSLVATTRAPRVRDVDFYGGVGVGGGGIGVKLLAAGAAGAKVTGAVINNIRVLSFATGVYLLNGTDGYVNFNKFSDITMSNCTTAINIESAGTYNNSFNEFQGVRIQPSESSPASDIGIKITDSDYNIFTGVSIVDAAYFDTTGIQIVSGLRNRVEGEGYCGYVADTGTQNSVVGAGKPLEFDSGTAGDTLTNYNAVFLKSDGKYWHADADAATTMPAVGLCATVAGAATVSADAKMRVIKSGRVYNASWNWSTIGGYIYVSCDPTTTNGLTETAPSGSGDQVQIFGYVESADSIVVDPQLILIEVA